MPWRVQWQTSFCIFDRVQKCTTRCENYGCTGEIVLRDTKRRPDEAVRVARELITRERVNFLVGTFTSAEGPAVSEIAKENKIVFIAPVPATDRLTSPDTLHPYVFRVAKNTTTE